MKYLSARRCVDTMNESLSHTFSSKRQIQFGGFRMDILLQYIAWINSVENCLVTLPQNHNGLFRLSFKPNAQYGNFSYINTAYLTKFDVKVDIIWLQPL